MLVAVGVGLAADAASARVTLGGADAGDLGLPLVVFKSLQLRHSRDFQDGFRDYVAFDIETTDRDPSGCEIVEIGAVRVEEGDIVDRYHSTVRPSRPSQPARRKSMAIAPLTSRRPRPLPRSGPGFGRSSAG